MVRTRLVGVLAMVALLAACTAHDPEAAPLPEPTDVTSASERVLASLARPEILAIHPDFVPSPGNENLPKVVVEVRPATSPAEEHRTSWLALLAGAAVAVQSDTAVEGMAVLEVWPSGRTGELEGQSLNGLERGSFPAAGRDDASIEADVISAVEAFGLEVGSVEVVRALDPAVSVVARLPDGVDVDWTLEDVVTAIEGSPRAYEGLALEIDDADGVPLIAFSRTDRSVGGGAWFAPGQDEVFGFTHGGMAGGLTP